jgi:hypothetical protein
MRSFCFLITYCIIWQNGFGQRDKDSYNPDQLNSKTYNLRFLNDIPVSKLPFSKIKVIDARWDTSKIGFISTGLIPGSRNNFEKLKLKSGVSQNLESYLKNFTTDQPDSNQANLLIVLKKFWITSSRPYDYQKFNSSNIVNGESTIIAKWELYIYKEDQYLPFRRIDTIISIKQSVKQLFKNEDAEYYNKETIYSILDGLLNQYNFSTAIKVFEQKQKKTLSEIIALNNERFLLPVLRDSIISKGVFLNFEEFKRNTPSIPDFKETKIRGARNNQITTEQGDPITIYWGYSGKYLKTGRYDSETSYRKGNTFEFFEKVRTMSTTGAHVPFFLDKGGLYWIPYQIDMETGAFY